MAVMNIRVMHMLDVSGTKQLESGQKNTGSNSDEVQFRIFVELRGDD